MAISCLTGHTPEKFIETNDPALPSSNVFSRPGSGGRTTIWGSLHGRENHDGFELAPSVNRHKGLIFRITHSENLDAKALIAQFDAVIRKNHRG